MRSDTTHPNLAERYPMGASRTNIWATWLTTVMLGGLCLADTLTTKSGRQYEGEVQDAGSDYVVVSPEGKKSRFAKETVASVEKKPMGRTPGSMPDRADGPKVMDNYAGRTMEVVATGAGVTPDEAVQSAYSAAIEQVVGVLVDAETLVKNDQVVSDRVRTFSRGFIQSYEKVKLWDKGGVHYVRIRAKVAVDALGDSLKGSKVATREVPGELIARQIRFDVKNEKDVAEIFQRAISGFDMTKLTTVEITGKPQIKRDGDNATMNLAAVVAPDLAKWGEFSKDLHAVLDKAATRRAAATTQSSYWSTGLDHLARQLQGEGPVVAVFGGANLVGDRIQWRLFRVPQSFHDVLRVKSARENIGYRVVFVLSSREGSEIIRSTTGVVSGSTHLQPLACCGMSNVGDVWWVGPVWHLSGFTYMYPRCVARVAIKLSVEDLAKVDKVIAYLESDK